MPNSQHPKYPRKRLPKADLLKNSAREALVSLYPRFAKVEPFIVDASITVAAAEIALKRAGDDAEFSRTLSQRAAKLLGV